MEKSERTIKAIHTYLDIVNSWLDETDGRLGELNTTKRQLLGRDEVDTDGLPTGQEVDGVDKSEVQKPGEEETLKVEKPGEEREQELSEDEKEHLRDEIRKIKENVKVSWFSSYFSLARNV